MRASEMTFTGDTDSLRLMNESPAPRGPDPNQARNGEWLHTIRARSLRIRVIQNLHLSDLKTAFTR